MLNEELHEGRLGMQAINETLTKQDIQTGPKRTKYPGILSKQDERDFEHAKRGNIENTKMKIQAVNLQTKPPPSNKFNYT